MSEDEAKADTGDESEEKAENSGGDESPKKKGAAKGAKKEKGTVAKKKSKSTHPKTVDMIIEAIEMMGERQGSSYQAIKSYILDHFKTVRPDMIKSMMRRALTTGLEKNIFARPKGQANTNAMSGRFLLGKCPRKEEEDEVMPQKSKRAIAAAALRTAKKSKKKGKKKKGKKGRKGRS